MADITALDEKEYVLLAHKNNPGTCFKLSVENVKKSGLLKALIESDQTIINSNIPIEISEGNFPEFNFIMKYLDFYDGVPEIAPPEHPLPRDKPINEIFEFEYVIFKEVINPDEVETYIVLLSNVIHLANHLEMETFYKKICAIIAYYIQLIQTPEERRRIIEILLNQQNNV